MTDAPVRQQLAAILAADVVSYSRLMERDEKGTLARLKNIRDEVVAPLVAEQGGRIFKTTGDGILCIFAAAAAAVECAFAIQAAVGAAEEAADDDARICFRIGVHLGDVLVDGEDVYGDGVNVAARLEAEAEAGGVCISGTAHDTLRGELGEKFADAGMHRLKNIARPIHIWRWQGSGGAPDAIATAGAGSAPTLAILPIACPGADTEAEALAEGIADDLTSTIARRTGVEVLAGSLRPAFSEAAGDLAALRGLGADYVLTGTLRRNGARIRLSAELLETAGGRQIWSDRYDREMDDPFALQDELTNAIGMAVRTSMNAYEGRQLGDAAPETLSDEQCRAKAAEHFYHFTAEGFQIAGRYLDAVLARNPRDAIALAMKAFSIGFGWMTRIRALPERKAAEVLDMAERAVQLNRSSDYVFTIRGLLALVLLGDAEAAIADARQALSISPHYAIAIALLGDALCYAGRSEEGIPLLRRAIDANPRDPANFARYWMLAMAYFGREEYEAALTEIEHALRLSREMPVFFLAQAAILQLLGRTEEASAVVAGIKQRHPAATIANIHQPRYTDPAIRVRYLDALRAAGLDE